MSKLEKKNKSDGNRSPTIGLNILLGAFKYLKFMLMFNSMKLNRYVC